MKGKSLKNSSNNSSIVCNGKFYISDLDKRQLSDAGRLGCCSLICGKNVQTV